MTYYECVTLLREITDKAPNDGLLNKFNQADIVFYQDMKYRFAIHVINTVKNKENKVFDKFISVITNELVELGAFSLEVINLKKELDYLEKIISSKIIPLECVNDIKGVYDNIINSYNNFVEKLLDKYYDKKYLDEYYNILNRKEG